MQHSDNLHKIFLILVFLVCIAAAIIALIYTVFRIENDTPVSVAVMIGMAIQTEATVIISLSGWIGVLVKDILDNRGGNDA